MRSPLEHVTDDVIEETVTDAWGLIVDDLRYFPQGGGAYHWLAYTNDGQRWFVTCDDLDTKPWFGHEWDIVFGGLVASYGTAMKLREAGHSFVVAPVATRAGTPAQRIDDRFCVSVLEYVDGVPGDWGRPVTPAMREQLVAMLAALHRSTPAAGTPLRRRLAVPGRHDFDEAMGDLGQPWDGGPLSEMARYELITHAGLIGRWFDAFDRFATELAACDGDGVVTHGEPHPGNLIYSADGLKLIDWDTVAIARPERDLWMLAEIDPTVAARYHELTGIALEHHALAAYRLLWGLADLVGYTGQLRGEHRLDADAERAVVALRSILGGLEPAPYGRPPSPI
jgi:spectinomycin phosphotransferase